MSTFDSVRSDRNGRSKGCPRCGATKNAGSVGLVLRQLGKAGQQQGGELVVTKTRSFCEPCAVEVYEALHAVLTAEREPTGA